MIETWALVAQGDPTAIAGMIGIVVVVYVVLTWPWEE